MKSRVLRGATMTVHSITPVPEPPEAEFEEEEGEKDDADGQDDAADDDCEEEAGIGSEPKEPEAESEPQDEEEAKEYFALDVTVTPQDASKERFWEPGEFILTSEKIANLEDLEDGEKEVGTAHEVLIWDGSRFGPDDAGKYPGIQRLKVTFGVKPGTSKAWLHYYSETIGLLNLPEWKPMVKG
jgi:hypothetical protein